MNGPGSERRREMVAAVLFGILLAVQAVLIIRQIAGTLLFPYPVDYREGVTLFWSHKAGLPGWNCLYPGVHPLRLIAHNPYTPLFPRLASLLHALSTGNLFFPGRLISLISLATAATSVFLLAGTDSRTSRIAAFAVFLCSPVVLRSGTLNHVDMLALGCSLAGVLAMERRQPALSAFLCALSFLAKPVYLSAAAACLVVSVVRRRKTAWLFSLLFLAVAATGLRLWFGHDLSTSSMWHPEPFLAPLLLHLVTLNALPLTAGHYLSVLTAVSAKHAILLAAAVFFLLREKGWASPLRWYVLFLLPASLLSAKTGAEENYYLELIAAGSIALGLRAGEKQPAVRRAVLLVAAAQLILSLPFAPAATFTRTYGQELQAGGSSTVPGKVEREAGKLIVEAVSATPGDVLSEDIGYLIEAGKKPWLEDPYQFSQLARIGRWDESPLLQRIERGEFSLVVLGQESCEKGESPYFTAAAVSAIRKHYPTARIVGKFYLLTPEVLGGTP